jgi:hypothetical protein
MSQESKVKENNGQGPTGGTPAATRRRRSQVWAGIAVLVVGMVIGVGLRALGGGQLGGQSLLGGLIPLNGTTNGPSTVYGNFAFSKTLFIANDGGLSNVQAFSVNVQASLDGSNFVTVGTYTPGGTAATNETFRVITYPNIFFRAQAVTTNSYGVGVTFQ